MSFDHKTVLILKSFIVRFLLALIVSYLLYLSFDADIRPDETLNNIRNIRKFLVSVLWLSFFFCAVTKFSFSVRAILVTALLLPSAFFAYLAIVYKLPSSVGLIKDVIESKIFTSEISAFISFEAIVATVLVLAVFLLISFLLGIADDKHPFLSKKIFIIFFILTILPAIFYKRGDEFYPIRKIIRPIKYSYRYFKVDKPLVEKLCKLENAKENSFISSPLASSTTVFLHIGESVRADHTSLYGYQRNTTPNLFRERKNNNLFIFDKSLSYSTSTRLSVIGILTSASIEDPIIRGQSFIPALNLNKIKTHAFFSSMNPYAMSHEAPLIALTYSCAERLFTPKYAPEIIPDIKKMLSQSFDNEHKFMLYYGEGNHTPYTKYESKYMVYKPVSYSLTRDARCVNNYDNSVLALDGFVNDVINLLREENAVYIYAADHGEFLGENGMWVRKADSMRHDVSRNILFFIWFSDKYKKLNSDKYNIFCENAKRLKIVSHDNIYHSILGLFNIVTERYSSKYDLFSKEVVEYSGKLPSELPENVSLNEIEFAE